MPIRDSPTLNPIYSNPLRPLASHSGIVPVSDIPLPGSVPYVIIGVISSPLNVYSLSNTASESVYSLLHFSTAAAKGELVSPILPVGAYFLPIIYLYVFLSGAIRPPLAPISILILQTVILPSILIFSNTSPAYSTKWPVPPAVPTFDIIYKITSFGVTFAARVPFMVILICLGLFCSKVWVARTISTSLVPMPKAIEPKAPWVAVWLSPHTIVIPGWVIPCSGPITCTIPCPGVSILKYSMPNSLQFFPSVSTGILQESSSIGLSWFVVGILWSAVANVWFGLKGFNPFSLSPVNAWGLVTS